MHKFGLFFSLSLLLFAACSPCLSTGNKSQSVKPVVAQLKEAFSTQRDENSNVDSPALWQGPDGQNWLLATAKEGNLISVYDASTGKFISQFGKPGSALGEFSRPNGIAVIDNYAIIVERDNHRVQVFSLPDLKPIGVFGDSVLRYPYGLAVDKVDGTYNIYITDNYETADGETPPAYNLGQRVHQYKLSIVNNQLSAVHQKAFGDTVGEGVLYTVESILIDRVHNRLLIADEHEEHRNIKIYDLNGTFTGQTIPHTYFFYEPEGIVVWECKADSSGYYICVDQDKLINTFQVFDRKTLKYIGGFGGEQIRNTDGIVISQGPMNGFEFGAFYAVHNDGNLSAIAWEQIADALGLRKSCE